MFNDFFSARESIESTAMSMFKANGKHYRSDCGSYLYSPRHSNGNMQFTNKHENKQLMLFNASRKASSVLETGTYMGHSLLIMLHANPRLRVTTIDLTDRYCQGGLDVLRTVFPESQIEFIQGDSRDVIPTLTSTYDMFHFDGSHKSDVVKEEFTKSLKLFDAAKPEIHMVLDDLFWVEKARDYIVSCCRMKQSSTSGGYNYNWYGVIDNTKPIEVKL